MPDELYKMTLEIVAEDREAATKLLLQLSNDGYESLRSGASNPVWVSIGGMSGNGVLQGAPFTKPAWSRGVPKAGLR